MPYDYFVRIAAQEIIFSNEQESRSSKTRIHKETDEDISAVL